MEEKIQLKILIPLDFEMWYQKFMPMGMAECVYWKKDYVAWSKFAYLEGRFVIV